MKKLSPKDQRRLKGFHSFFACMRVGADIVLSFEQFFLNPSNGGELYPQRMAIVEPVFANIRARKRMDCFSLRGKINVNIQWLPYCMVHNIEKIANYGFT